MDDLNVPLTATFLVPYGVTASRNKLERAPLHGIPVYHIPKLEKQAVDFLKRTGNWNKYGML